MSIGELPDHVRKNRELWDSRLSGWFSERAQLQWAAEPHWGLWAIPQTDLPVLPADLHGKDVIELGCGTAYVCAWAKRRGARPVGIDNSAHQLSTARAMQDTFGLHFPLLHGNAEAVPLPDASFDVAISEHGASAWCDPYRWIPEAARLLRPGGELVFINNSTLLTLCLDDDAPGSRTLQRDQFGLHRLEDDGEVTFQISTGSMIRLLRQSGFEIEDLIEVYAPENASSAFDYVDLDWARRWPSEEVWKARRATQPARDR
jgi:SAM-dependent methyltransferase